MEQTRKTTEDLIAELIKDSKKFQSAAMVVAFERKTKGVLYNPERKPQELLNELNLLVEQGGKPIGIIGILVRDELVFFMYKPFAEYADDDWAAYYLKAICVRSTEEAIKDGILRGVTVVDFKPPNSINRFYRN